MVARISKKQSQEQKSAEADRISEIRSEAQIPENCGSEIRSAPGRGAFVLVRPSSVVPKGEKDWVVKPGGYLGRDALRARDVFDEILEQSMRRARGGATRLRFTEVQVDTGRRYRALVERENAAGYKMSSLDSVGGGANGEDPIDRRLRQAAALEKMREAIGSGWALEMRRAAPNGDKRRPIKLRTAVDLLCLKEKALAWILASHGWARGRVPISALHSSIAGALDRMNAASGGTPPDGD